MSKAIIKDRLQAQRLIDSLDYSEPLELTIKVYDPKRTTSQNALVNSRYNELDKRLGLASGESRRFCKLHFGVGILRAEDEDFRAFYDQALKWQTYEQKLKSMQFVPVTSLMSKKQLTRYADAMSQHHADQFGIVLDW